MLLRDVLSSKEAIFLGLAWPYSMTGGKMTRPEGWEEDRQRFWQSRLTSMTRKRWGVSGPETRSRRSFLRCVARQGTV